MAALLNGRFIKAVGKFIANFQLEENSNLCRKNINTLFLLDEAQEKI